MRFDDSLETVLAADMSTPFGAQTAWRQLVDLVGRRRVPADARVLMTLETIRPRVAPPVRAATARGLAMARPPFALVRLFALDELAVAAPVLRTARLFPSEWIALLPMLTPANRSILRHRRDLPPEVVRALEAFGAVDFRLPSAHVADAQETASAPGEAIAVTGGIDGAEAAGADAGTETVGSDGTAEAPALAALGAGMADVDEAPSAAAVEAAMPAIEADDHDGLQSQGDVPPAQIPVPEMQSEIAIPAFPSWFTAAESPPESMIDGPATIADSLPMLDGDGLATAASDAVGLLAEDASATVIDDAALMDAPAVEAMDAGMPDTLTEAAVAELDGADLSGADLGGADLSGAELGVATQAIDMALPGGAPLATPSLGGSYRQNGTPADQSDDRRPQSDFVPLGQVALGLPFMSAALRHVTTNVPAPSAPEAVETDLPVEAPESASVPQMGEDVAEPDLPADHIQDTVDGLSHDGVQAPQQEAIPTGEEARAEAGPGERSQIAELVARIDAYQRNREAGGGADDAQPEQPALFQLEAVRAESFRFETDERGVIRWVEGAARAALIGLSIDRAAKPGEAHVDGSASGAYRQRARFQDARLVVPGTSDAAGQWRISGVPAFDDATGRFTGYRGVARRPRADEMPEKIASRGDPLADSLRQLVHELRTPANAISGFAEMIETQLLGPVPQAYREQAAMIREQAAGLLGAIEDVDLAARIEASALDLQPGRPMLRPMLARIANTLAPLASARSAVLAIDPFEQDLALLGDDRALERLITRTAATMLSAASPGEVIAIRATTAPASSLADIEVTLPVALKGRNLAALIQAGDPDDLEGNDAETGNGGALLGTGFALRLVSNLAGQLGGSAFLANAAAPSSGESTADDAQAQGLTLRLPATLTDNVDQVFSV